MFVGVPLCLVAVQLGLAPPLEPTHCHVVELPWAGFVGVEGLGVPAAQYAPPGNVSVAVYVFAANPHWPLTGAGAAAPLTVNIRTRHLAPPLSVAV